MSLDDSTMNAGKRVCWSWFMATLICTRVVVCAVGYPCQYLTRAANRGVFTTAQTSGVSSCMLRDAGGAHDRHHHAACRPEADAERAPARDAGRDPESHPRRAQRPTD